MTQDTRQKPTGPMSEDDLATALAADLEDAATYADTELGPLRAAAIHYYHARKFGDEEDGRSQVVMPVVRDTIRATLPSLMRKFFGTRQPVTFAPGSINGGQFADDATATVNYVFTVQNDGYSILWDGFKDALRCKTGWLKWWWDETVEVSAREYSDVTPQQLLLYNQLLLEGESIEIVNKTIVGYKPAVSAVPLPQQGSEPAAGSGPAEQSAYDEFGNEQPGQAPDPFDEGVRNPTTGIGPDGEPDEDTEGRESMEAADAPSAGVNEDQTGAEESGSQEVSRGSNASTEYSLHPPQPTHALVAHKVPIYTYTIRVTSKKPKKQVKIAAVPPDEVIFPHDSWDREFKSGRLLAHRRRLTRGELVAMGVNPDDLESIPSDDVDQLTNIEFLARQTIPSAVMTQSQNATWDQVRVPFYECYYRVDADGDGISELRKICRIGKTGKIVSNEIWDEVPFAMLCPDPEPHVVVGLSQADYVMDVQNVTSHVWRDLLDSLKQSIFPRMVVVEGQTNLDDALNSEIGAVIRARAPGMVQPIEIPFTGQNAFPMLDKLDQVREQRTGIGNAALALDGSALQSTTPVAAQATVSASQDQVELTARMFANGIARMMRGVLRLLVRHEDKQMTFELNGRTFNVNPLQFNPDLETIIDTGLGAGTNTKDTLEMFDGVAQAQMALMGQLGPDNPICGIDNYYATVTRMMQLGGVRDTHRYWRDPSVTMQPGPQQKNFPPPKPSPEEINAQSQQTIEKARLAKDRLKIVLDNELARDKMLIDARLRGFEIQSRYGSQFDTKLIDVVMHREKLASAEAISQAELESAPAQGDSQQ